MTEERYLELMDEDPDEALKWIWKSKFCFFTTDDGISGFDKDLLQDFLGKLLKELDLTEQEAIRILNEEDMDTPAWDTLDELNIKAVQDKENQEKWTIDMYWDGADAWQTVEWLEKLGFDIEYYGEDNGIEGQIGVYFIRSPEMMD